LAEANRQAKEIQQIRIFVPMLLMMLLLLTACSSVGGAGANPEAGLPNPAAADYCRQSGGVVKMRYPFYGTNSANPLQLSGTLDVCTFATSDGSRILVSLDTLYTDQPTLAALAYRAKMPVEGGRPRRPIPRACTARSSAARIPLAG
jgi:hypothetical protein